MEIVTETSAEPSPIELEDEDKEVLQNEAVHIENTEKRFITSPADIEVIEKWN